MGLRLRLPLAVPWHNNKTLRKDPHPTPAEFNADVCNYLVDNPAPFRKFLEHFLCFVGISRYYDLDENCYLTFWANDDEGGCSLLASFDPTKVRIGERVVTEGEVSLLQLTMDCVVSLAVVNDQVNANVQGVGNDDVNEEGGDAAVADQTDQGDYVVQIRGIDIAADDEAKAIVADKPKKVRKKIKATDGASGSFLPPKKLREDHGTSGDVGASTGGKSLAEIQDLFEQSTLNVEVGITAAATVPFVTSSVTPTPKRKEGTNPADDEVTFIVRSFMPPPHALTAATATTIIADSTSASVPGASTGPVLHSIFRDSASTCEAYQDIVGPSHLAGTENSTDSFFVSQDVDSATFHQTYIPKWNVTNNSALDDPDVFRGVIDHLAPPTLFS
ncbi:hypothetical protein Tco_1539273 [Tanacetum coccineum]